MLRVAVLLGGRSEEHEVSCVSAGSVLDAVPRDRYEPLAVGIDKDGGWWLLPDAPRMRPGADRLPRVDPAAGESVVLAGGGLVKATGERLPVDVVFPVLHGPYGEDGTIQGMLEFMGLPYVGAGVLASAVAMDKAVAKVLFRAAGLPIVDHAVVTAHEWREDREAVYAGAKALGLPLFVKPASLGSSVGITKVKEEDGLDPAIDEAFAHGSKAIIEAAVPGAREIECSVLGNEEPVASVPGEIVPAGEFYDYRSKYLDDRTELIVPADLPPEVTEEVQRMAVAAFEVVDCAGMARVDFLLGGGRVHLNEVNTIPGFTGVSMYPKMWEASGLPYPELIHRLIQLALERHRRPERVPSA
jgi:D-alanine-D-alanine ligase